MSRYRAQVAAALEAVSIDGPTRYAWLGRRSRPPVASLDSLLDAQECRDYLVASLRKELYRSFFCHGAPVPALGHAPEPDAAEPELAATIAAANGGRGSWQDGWIVERLDGREAVVSRTRMRVRVPLDDCRAPSGALRSGVAAAVRLPKELPSLSPGFCTVVGDAGADPGSWPCIVRAYWNVSAAGAPVLVRELTRRLNGDGVRFRLKVADHPFRYDRCDAAVLYVSGDAFGALAEPLRALAGMLAAHLRPRIPAFTLALAPGVGLAEDDGVAESFGERRCALLAEAMVGAHERGETHPAARLEAVVARFVQDGVAIDAPYLAPSLAGRHVL